MILILIIFIGISLLLPTTPRASKSLLFSFISKTDLLKNTESPRIIFVGGSNLSFGLNSRAIEERLNSHPINTGIHAGIGLKFMIESVVPLIRQGDLVVLIPEYSHYFLKPEQGSQVLLRLILDVEISNVKFLSFGQIINLLPFLPHYAIRKFDPFEYINTIESDIYSVNSFNEYGDADVHWVLEQESFSPFDEISTEFNDSVLNLIIEFEKHIAEKGGMLFVSFPGFQEQSYINQEVSIDIAFDKLERSGLKLLGSPERYKMPDEYIFNTPYHLNKKGVDYRTELLIKDMEYALSLIDVQLPQL